MEKKIDWVVHLVKNGVRCEECGVIENGFLPYFCNVHTYGMKKYGQLEFQIVLDMDTKMQMYILNRLGLMVQGGRIFKSGEIIDGICEGYSLKLLIVEENGEQILRVLIPDENHKFPGDEGCEEQYNLQVLPVEDFMVKNENPIIRILQIPEDNPRQRELLYESLADLKKKCDGKVPLELYEKVYEGNLGEVGLEDLFYIFNMEFPIEYKGRSLSVSDIVEFEYNDGKKASYYCDSVGFKLLTVTKNEKLN